MLEPTATLVDILAALDNKEISSTELLDAALARIERLDGPVNAVVTLAEDRARAEAAAIDAARATGEPVGGLAGVPITIKDALATEGIRSTGGATELAHHVPHVDAEAVARVRADGAIVFGKTNLPRWSGDVQTHNALFGRTSNPWNLDRTPGGSSGGAAAAVAMGFTPFEIGTDIGGSVRNPASNCGVYGHKPSFGVIPTHGYLDHALYHRSQADVNVVGPFARSIGDLELLFELLSGPSDDDAAGWRLDLPPARATDLGGFRVVAWLDDELCPVEAEVADVFDRMCGQLEAAGAVIDHEKRPAFDPLEESGRGLVLIGSATEISDGDAEWNAKADAELVLSHRAWDLERRRRDMIRVRWAEFFEDVDIVLCPVAPVAAVPHRDTGIAENHWSSPMPGHEHRPYIDLVRWTALTGSAYLPATVPPVGRTDAGLPVGVQVVAPYLHDRTALAFARAMSDVVGGYDPPPLAVDGQEVPES